ncbi:MAG: hypothetical protein IPK53_03455 [bacterium]|nr:hypothetical protein [bacterium]
MQRKNRGFYDLCLASGPTSSQGVLIPAPSVNHLILRQDVMDAVGNGRFHIYPIHHIDEGIELLTGIPARGTEQTGSYPAESINGPCRRPPG